MVDLDDTLLIILELEHLKLEIETLLTGLLRFKDSEIKVRILFVVELKVGVRVSFLTFRSLLSGWSWATILFPLWSLPPLATFLGPLSFI